MLTGFAYLPARVRRWIDRRLRRSERRRRRASAPTAQRWEAEYRDERWAFLNRLEEMGRYAVLAGYVRRLKPGGAVLDVGCGEGLLREDLGAACARYVGVDVSPEAVRRAQPRADARTRFVAATAETFEPEGRFDVVVFNECLYCFDDPLEVLRRYAGFLAPGGLVMASMYAEARPRRIWRALRPGWKTVDEVCLLHPSGKAWTVKVLAPPQARPPW